MNEAALNLPPAKWQTCVSTVKCDLIDEYVSIMVKNDWASSCTWYNQFKAQTSGDQRRIKPDRKTRSKLTLCQGPLCSYVVGYRDKLIQEEQKATS